MNFTERDQKVIWHPYTSLQSPFPITITHGKEEFIYDETGKQYIDAISSWWVNLHGHSHPYINKKIQGQIEKLEHVIFAGFTHAPAIELAERLLKLIPGGHQKVFYSDNGSTAVEAAVKMAIQYWHNLGQRKTKIITLKNSFHGDTFGAMSVSERGIFTHPFQPLLFDIVQIDAPTDDSEFSEKQLEEIIEKEGKDIAAFIYEPIVQGAAGMVIQNPEKLNRLLKICKKHDIIIIADEVMAGFGRTGKIFASEYMEAKPDIMCLSKGITGGYLPLGATTCSARIVSAFDDNDSSKTFFHGHSYTANPIGCAAANASLDLLLSDECQNNIKRIEHRNLEFSKLLAVQGKATNIRAVGTILAMNTLSSQETSYLNKNRNKIYSYFLDKGILIRPLGNIIYIMPPYCISDNSLTKIYNAITNYLNLPNN